jgi:hypothetical protein
MKMRIKQKIKGRRKQSIEEKIGERTVKWVRK